MIRSSSLFLTKGEEDLWQWSMCLFLIVFRQMHIHSPLRICINWFLMTFIGTIFFYVTEIYVGLVKTQRLRSLLWRLLTFQPTDCSVRNSQNRKGTYILFSYRGKVNIWCKAKWFVLLFILEKMFGEEADTYGISNLRVISPRWTTHVVCISYGTYFLKKKPIWMNCL